ncbi:hypothetical protein [Nakamurella leprariae]|uniref:Uncharacterized protein n=1 Tax=Nakamurella leprariae TaxID=2803911 RepID=A0A939BWE1_9ACTN|nr:hypothetical protein [Nakamurella leprariae]MBM9467453.1 hypothetical protein [Nakamurella leprariae]
MSATNDPEPGAEQRGPAVDRRRLDEVFGTTLPDVTRDELDPGSSGAGGTGRDERWYRENRPPHHGG